MHNSKKSAWLGLFVPPKRHFCTDVFVSTVWGPGRRNERLFNKTKQSLEKKESCASALCSFPLSSCPIYLTIWVRDKSDNSYSQPWLAASIRGSGSNQSVSSDWNMSQIIKMVTMKFWTVVGRIHRRWTTQLLLTATFVSWSRSKKNVASNVVWHWF